MNESGNKAGITNPQTLPSLKFIDMPAVLAGEDSAEYEQLRQQIEDFVRPLDIFERMYVSDLAYYYWESLRYRRIIANLVNASKRFALERILSRLLPPKSEDTMVVGPERSLRGRTAIRCLLL
jgi:hypothetical protein